MWSGEDHQRVALRGVEVTVRLGLLERERRTAQKVIVDVELWRRHRGYAGGGLGACLDYDRIHRHLREVWPKRPHTGLLEELAEDLVALCFEDPKVEACRVRIRKPEVYEDGAVPELEVFRRRAGLRGDPPPDRRCDGDGRAAPDPRRP